MFSLCAKVAASSCIESSLQRNLVPLRHHLYTVRTCSRVMTHTQHICTQSPNNTSQVAINSSQQRLKPPPPPPPPSTDGQPSRDKLPNEDELYIIKEHMIQYIPFFFTMSHQYRIYRSDIIFENNLYDPTKTTIGISRYATEVAKLRMYAHCKYANVKASVISADSCLISGSVRVHWKVEGISQKSAFLFWNFMPWNYRKAMKNLSLSTEGISTFYVNGGDGVVLKHRIDNVVLDEDSMTKDKVRLKANKLGFT